MISHPKIAFVASLILGASRVAAAQCSDGTPPPCDTRRAAPMTVVKQAAPLPSAADRGRRFLILPFRNVTRQADQDWLVEGSTTLLVDALSRWQGITVVPDEKLYPALKRAGITPGTVADEAKVRRVAEETGGWTAVTGDVLSTGGRTRISARAWDVATGKELVRASTEVAQGGDARAAYDSLSLKLLHTAGIDGASSDLATTTTRNLDAYKSYLSGNAHMRRAEMKPALADFQAAIREDSGFAMAWARLSEVSLSVEPTSIMNPQSAPAGYAARAVALSAKLTDRDRQLVLANGALFNAQFDTGRKLLLGLLAKDSNDVDALGQLIGIEASDFTMINVPGGQRPRGSKNRAAWYAKRALQIDPSRQPAYAALVTIYTAAGVPGGTPDLGVPKEPTSFADLMATVRRREGVRFFYPLLRDSLVLVPLESLTVIPHDSVELWRKNARAAARGWAERWQAAAPNEAAPYLTLAQLNAFDHDYAAALRALNKADSIGVQLTTLSAPVRRMVYLARLGDYKAATHLADSLAGTTYFSNPNAAITNGDALMWAFAIEVMTGRYARAVTLLDAQTNMYRSVNPTMSQLEMAGFLAVMGNDDPAEEPGIPRSFRAMQLDSLVAHIGEAAAVPKLAPWLPQMLQEIAADADSTQRRMREVLKAAESLAAAGHTQLAFEIASTAVASDSLLEADAAKFAWYRAGAEAYNNAKAATEKRFTPKSATVGADRAVFEWAVDDSLPFTRNRAETPGGRREYAWEVLLAGADRGYRIQVGADHKSPTASLMSGPLSEILTPGIGRTLYSAKTGPDGELLTGTMVPAVAVRTELAPGVMRVVITDTATLADIRRLHPATALLRFEPCTRPVGSTAKLVCSEAKLPIVYP